MMLFSDLEFVTTRLHARYVGRDTAKDFRRAAHLGFLERVVAIERSQSKVARNFEACEELLHRTRKLAELRNIFAHSPTYFDASAKKYLLYQLREGGRKKLGITELRRFEDDLAVLSLEMLAYLANETQEIGGFELALSRMSGL